MSPPHDEDLVLEPLLVSTTLAQLSSWSKSDTPVSPNSVYPPLNPSLGKRRKPCSFTFRNCCAATVFFISLAGYLLFAIGMSTGVFFASISESKWLYEADHLESFPVRPYFDANTTVDCWLQVYERNPDREVSMHRVFSNISVDAPISTELSLQLPAFGPLNHTAESPIAGRLIMVKLPHDYTESQLAKLKPTDGLKWNRPTEPTRQPVRFFNIEFLMYLYRSVDAELPTPANLDMANTTSPQVPHLLTHLINHRLPEDGVFDGAKFLRALEKKRITEEVCERTTAVDTDARTTCMSTAIDIVNDMMPNGSQPWERMFNSSSQDGTTMESRSYLPDFVFPASRVRPSHFIPMDPVLGMPLGISDQDESFTMPFYISFSPISTQSFPFLGISKSRPKNFTVEERHSYKSFPPRLPNATYHAHDYERVVDGLDLVTSTRDLSSSYVPGNRARIFMSFIPFSALGGVYWLTRLTTVGISRSGVQTTALGALGATCWNAYNMYHLPMTFDSDVPAFIIYPTIALSIVVTLLTGGLGSSLVALSVTHKWHFAPNPESRFLPSFPRPRSGSLGRIERRSDAAERVPWTHRLALLAVLALIWPHMSLRPLPTTLRGIQTLYRHRTNYEGMGPMAGRIFQMRTNWRLKTFAGTYKALLALELAVLVADAGLTWTDKPRLDWLPWMDFLALGGLMVQAIMYPSVENVVERDYVD
ncbi:hypothetical protein HKX48_008307 [Thoreauomyces humboldtii]|nr:hypothetical protein HKX48_008307 [Thoreauomyces humboldtii]